MLPDTDTRTGHMASDDIMADNEDRRAVGVRRVLRHHYGVFVASIIIGPVLYNAALGAAKDEGAWDNVQPEVLAYY